MIEVTADEGTHLLNQELYSAYSSRYILIMTGSDQLLFPDSWLYSISCVRRPSLSQSFVFAVFCVYLRTVINEVDFIFPVCLNMIVSNIVSRFGFFYSSR